MSRTMRILFLSVVLTVFAASFALADISISKGDYDDYVLTTDDSKIIEGYTFTTNYVVDGDFTYANTDYTLAEAALISWDVSEANGKDISWLKKYTVSDDIVLILEGTLPRHISGNNEYSITVTANAQYNIGSRKPITSSAPDTFTITILSDRNSSEHVITPLDRKTNEWEVFFSTDLPNPLYISKDYEAHLIVPDDGMFLAEYIHELDEYNTILPVWLSYDVVNIFDVDNENYLTDIKFFYVDKGYDPLDGTTTKVAITGVDVLDEETGEPTNSGEYEIKWTITVGAANTTAKNIALASDTVSFDITYGDSASKGIKYTGASPVSWTINTGSTSTIGSQTLGLAVTSNDDAITITVTPTAAGYYTGTITFTASDNSKANLALIVSVEPKLTLSEDKFTLTADFNTDSSDTISYENGTTSSQLARWNASPAVPAFFGIDVSSADKEITIKIHPAISGDYKGTFTFTDTYGKTASIPVELHALPQKTSPGEDPNKDPVNPSNPETPAFTITNPDRDLQITAGGTITANFVSNNGKGDITWTRNVTEGTGIEVSFSPTTGARTIATITASDSATDSTVVVTATDGLSRTVNATLSITVTNSSTPITPPTPTPGDDPVDDPITEPTETIMDVDPLEFVRNTANALGMSGAVYDETPETVAAGGRDLSGVSSVLPDSAVSVLPVMYSDKTGIFTFNVNSYLAGAVIGELLNVYVQQVTLGGGSVGSAESTSAALVDGSGNRIYYYPEDGNVNMAIYMEQGQSYASAITHMQEGDGPGDPKGGCSAAGLNAFALLFASPLFFRKRK